MLINFECVCRCCLRSGSLKSIFSEMIPITTVGYDKMIEYVCSEPVSKNDGLASQICSECICKLSASYKFKQKCIESLTELNNFKEQICPSIKLEPKLDEFQIKYERDEASHSNIILDQIQCLQYLHKENNDFDNVRDSKENCDLISHRFNKDIKNEINNDSQTSKLETEVGVETIIEEPVLKIYIKEERKQCDENKATRKGSPELKIKNKKVKLTCDICGKSYKLLNRLKEHIRWVHQGIKPYHCPICNKDYMNENGHQETHGTFSATCEKCGQKFTRQKTYKMHLESHENNEYKCKCGKTFKVKTHFHNHRRHVHGPRRYACHICPKTFTKKACFDDHFRTHSDERPFKCEFCGMTFRINKVRVGHIKMKHSNVRPHKCKQCDKEFKTRSILVKHMIIHEERRYACRICKQPFGRADNRNVHERSVHGLVKEEVKTIEPVNLIRESSKSLGS